MPPRKRYVPLSVHFAHGRTGTALLEELGRDGLLVWVCLIAAAKRSSVPGQFIHLSDAETWEQFGLASTPPSIAFEDVLSVTGRLKQTSRRRHGRVLYVTLTHYGDWNDAFRTGIATAQKSSKRAQSRPDTTVPEYEVEVEGEVEGEKNPPTPLPATPRGKSLRDKVWDALVVECGNVTTTPARKLRGQVVTDLIAVGATGEEVRRRVPLLKRRWPGADMTDTAVRKHWDKADLPLPQGERGRGESQPDRIAASTERVLKARGHETNGHHPEIDLELTALQEAFDE